MTSVDVEAKGGASIRVRSLLVLLSRYFDKVLLLSPSKGISGLNLANIDVFYIQFKKVNEIFSFYKYGGVKEQLKSLIERYKPVCAIIDYNFYGQYISYLKKKGLFVIYGTHNAQAELILQKTFVNPFKVLLNYMYYVMSFLHERVYFSNADLLFVTSEADKEYHSKFVSASKLVVVPNVLINDEYEIDNLIIKENYIVFPASFTAFQNSSGLEWFARNVWDKNLQSQTKLVLAGRGSKELLNKLSLENMNIEALGYVENMQEIIAKARAVIVPLLYGSGTRLKCLEAMALKTQIISTYKGCEGISQITDSVILCNNPYDFKSAILAVLSGDIDTTNIAYSVYKDNYTVDSIYPKLCALLEEYEI